MGPIQAPPFTPKMPRHPDTVERVEAHAQSAPLDVLEMLDRGLVYTPPNPAVDAAVDAAARETVERYLGQIEATRDETGHPDLAGLIEATGDFFNALPIGSFKPELRASIERYLRENDRDVAGLHEKSLSDFGSVGRRFASHMAGELEAANPETFAGIAVLGGAALGYFGGSEALEALGIDPELETTIFDDQIELRATASWDEKLKDPRIEATALGAFRLGPGARLTAGAMAVVDGDDPSDLALSRLTGRAMLTAGDVRVDASAKVLDRRLEEARIRARYEGETIGLSATVDLEEAGALEDVEVSLSIEDDHVEIGFDAVMETDSAIDASIDARFEEGDARAAVEVDVEDGSFAGAELDVRFQPDEFDLRARVQIDEDVHVESATLEAGYDDDTSSLEAELQLGQDGALDAFRVAGSIEDEDASAAVEIQFDEDGFSSASLTGQAASDSARVRYRATFDEDGFDDGRLDLSVDHDDTSFDFGVRLENGRFTGAEAELAWDTEAVDFELGLSLKEEGAFDGVSAGLAVEEGPFALSAAGSLDDELRIDALRIEAAVDLDGHGSMEASLEVKDAELEEVAMGFDLELDDLALSAGVAHRGDATSLSIGANVRF